MSDVHKGGREEVWRARKYLVGMQDSGEYWGTHAGSKTSLKLLWRKATAA